MSVSSRSGNKPRRPTVMDIAKESNVSIATVSYVISGRPDVHISQETRTRVLDAAKKLGYTRNGLAAALRTGRMNTLAIVCPLPIQGVGAEQGQTYLNDSILALTIAIAKAEMNAMLFINDGENQLNPSEIADRRVDGAILLCASLAPEWVEAVYQTGLPCVEIGTSYGQYQVHTDNYAGSREATQHLLSMGHRRVAHWAGPQYMVSGRERKRGYQDAMLAAGVLPGDSPVMENEQEVRKLLSKSPRPTGIVCSSDQQAFEVLKMAKNLGIKVPEELSVVGFDNDLRAICAEPNLTTVLNPLQQIAEEALKMVRAQIDGRPVEKNMVLIPTQLVVRDSTAAIK